MRLIDRYITKEFFGPFLFGVGAFVVILVGIVLSPQMLRLLVRDQYPASIVLRIFLYRLPALFVLTFPMATIFGSLMALANLSSHGEVIAMRAGSVSLGRIAVPVLCLGLLISLSNLAINEVLVPWSNDAAYELTMDYSKKARAMEHLTFQLPTQGEPERIVYAKKFDPKRKLLEGLIIIEMRDGNPWEVLKAESAEWAGNVWHLRSVEHRQTSTDGSQRLERVALMTYDVGKSPDEIANREKDPSDMSLAELRTEVDKRRRDGVRELEVLKVLQAIQMHWALPWASLGFAFIGVPLGLRPARATTGIGLGLSLVIVFAYYIIYNTLSLVGQQGTLPPWVVAWLPNGILFGAGLGLFLSADR